MRYLYRFFSLLVLAALLLASASCGSAAGPASAAGTTPAGMESSGPGADEFEIAVTGGSEDDMILNPARASTLEGLSACRHLYEGLYRLGRNGEPEPGQAAEAAVSEDLLTWTFTLRDDIVWSDGKKVTADDFLYGWEYLEEEAGDYFDLLAQVAESWEAADEHTIILRLRFPCSFLPYILAFPSTSPVRADYVEKYGEAYATDPEKAVYNGPYAMTGWQHGGTVVMERRKEYYDAETVRTGTIRWELISEERSALAAFENGEIVFSALCPEEEKGRMEEKGRAEEKGLFYVPGNNSYCILFNQGPGGAEALKDVRVRRALALAIDRQFLLSLRGQRDEIGKTLACSGYTDAAGLDFTEYAAPWPEADTWEQGCEEARKLLKDAGYENGEGMPPMTYIVNNDSRREIAEAVVHDWKEQLGIDTITVEKRENFFSARYDGDYDMAYFGWFMDYPDLSNMYGCMNNMEHCEGFWRNEEYEDAWRTAIRSADQKRQWEQYARCEDILAQDLPITVLFHGMDSYLFDADAYEGMLYACGNYIFTYLREKK